MDRQQKIAALKAIADGKAGLDILHSDQVFWWVLKKILYPDAPEGIVIELTTGREIPIEDFYRDRDKLTATGEHMVFVPRRENNRALVPPSPQLKTLSD